MYFGLNCWLANQKMWDKCVSNMKGIHIQMTSWIFFPQMCKICVHLFLIYKNNGLSQSAYMDVTPLFWFSLIWFCMGWGFLFCFALLLFDTITKVKKMFSFYLAFLYLENSLSMSLDGSKPCRFSLSSFFVLERGRMP